MYSIISSYRPLTCISPILLCESHDDDDEMHIAINKHIHTYI